MKKFLLLPSPILLLLTSILLLVGCSKTSDTIILEDASYYQYLDSSNPTVEFVLSDNSKIKFELFKDIAPTTVKNFLSLISAGYYDDTDFNEKCDVFISAFQFNKNLPNYTIKGEFTENGYQNPLSFSEGILGLMHNHSNDDGLSELFISFQNIPEFDGKFAYFGGVTEGFSTLKFLQDLKPDSDGFIRSSLRIDKVNIDAKGFDYSTFEKIETLPFENAMTFLNDTNPKIKMTIKDFGIMELELFNDVAPITVENFLTLVDDNFYDGLTISNIFAGHFTGGIPTNDPSKSTDAILGEFFHNGVNNNISHDKGVISMWRDDAFTDEAFNSATNRFIICNDDLPVLNKYFAAFGYVVSGLDVADKIAAVSFNSTTGAPNIPIIIEKIERIS